MNRIIRRLMAVALTAAVVSTMVLNGCRPRSHNAGLERLAVIVDGSPEVVLDLLAGYDSVNLDRDDRHYRDLLELKARDRAHIKPQSDSLALSVVKYFERSGDRRLYPEALYYCGRAYFSLGDYPSAIRYYQSALDELPYGAEPCFRRLILSQTGRLLNNMRLYRQAIPYLEECIELTEQEGNSDMLRLDRQLLGLVFMHLEEYDKADSCLRAALDLASDDRDAALAEGHIAALKYYAGEIDSAEVYITGISERIHPADKDFINLTAANIFVAAQKWVPAYHYASALIRSDYPRYQVAGYQILLEPEMRGFIARDSADEYISRYIRLANKQFDDNDMRAVIAQNSMYNYSAHERQSKMLYESRSRLMTWLCIVGAISVLIGSGLIFMGLKIRAKNKSLTKLLVTIHALNRRLYDKEGGDPSVASAAREQDDVTDDDVSASANGLHKMIASEIKQLKARLEMEPDLPDEGQDSEGYRLVTEALDRRRILAPDAPEWEVIRESVIALSPSFESTLRRLSLNRLKRDDYQLAYLLRLGIPSARVADLIGRDKASITYRRRRLCEKVFNNKINVAQLNDILLLI